MCEGIVEKVKFPNKGIVKVEDSEVTVKNTIPGQKVSFVINKKRKGKAEGRLLEILEKSELENAEANCPHYGVCGGCNYQTLPYEEQLKLKAGQVLELMKAVVPNAEDIFEGIRKSPQQFGYRNKMEYTFGDEVKDGPLALGMHKRGSFYDIVTVDECRIVDDDYRKILGATVAYFRAQDIPFYHRMRHEGYLRHLLVRKAVKTEEILIDLITTTQEICAGESCVNETALLDGWKEQLLALELDGSIAGILHTKNDSVADAVKNEGTEILYGKDYFYEELLGLKFRISPFSFFQTNSLGAEVLYQTAREYIGDSLDEKAEKTVYDLYSGTGTIAQILSPAAKHVIGVEIVEEAVEAAKENAQLNQLKNCDFIAGDVLKVLDSIEEKPDFIVLDPPREGIHPKALEKIIRYGVDRMIYISCKPTSLQRDLEVLQAQGYVVERICCVDMFPGTVHVETVVLLSQHRDKNTCLDERGSRQIEMQASRLASLLAQKPDDTIEIDLDLDELDATSAELKATYQEIKDYVLKEFGLKVSSLYISQVKRKCGIEVGENYNLPKSENARVPQCPKEKEDAIKAALKYFAML
ncbi:23S rRNA (uracil-5-)-methyltransferase RumA [Eubacterium ramulus ATCC 29099]|uniref:23S rRNA (Uracil-5-)-methyltransferase RumA n=2 Tax=Eubacterium ramulus TaxID=39490 RepID=U2NZ89_EUBRA|nr:23S rRNA (uracil-5-)-methyltransferase RumA [Eubacterium ramulus ATCC 29099]